jgi:hypothetical protein
VFNDRSAVFQGLKEYSVPIGLEAKVKVDLIVIGSVAVSKEGKGKKMEYVVKNCYCLQRM